MTSPKIFIIIINWNGKGDTIECLESLEKLEYKNYEIVVVDNGSKDDSVDALKNRFPKITLLEARRNLGFAGGNNLGMRYALEHGADFILLLNNDTIANGNLMDKLLEASEYGKRKGIYGAKIYYYSQPNKIWYAGAERRNNAWVFEHIGYGNIEKEEEIAAIIETEYACGCALFIDVILLRQVGLFDEKFFLLFEETDLCYRAKKMGIKSFLVPGAKVWHKASLSFGGENSPKYHYFFMRNKLLWGEKNLKLSERVGMFKIACREIAGFLRAKNRKNPILRAKVLGFRDYLVRRFGNCSAPL